MDRAQLAQRQIEDQPMWTVIQLAGNAPEARTIQIFGKASDSNGQHCIAERSAGSDNAGVPAAQRIQQARGIGAHSAPAKAGLTRRAELSIPSNFNCSCR